MFKKVTCDQIHLHNTIWQLETPLFICYLIMTFNFAINMLYFICLIKLIYLHYIIIIILQIQTYYVVSNNENVLIWYRTLPIYSIKLDLIISQNNITNGSDQYKLRWVMKGTWLVVIQKTRLLSWTTMPLYLHIFLWY